MSSFGRLVQRIRDQRGQGLAEYALILGLIAVVAIVSLMFLGDSLRVLVFSTIGQTL